VARGWAVAELRPGSGPNFNRSAHLTRAAAAAAAATADEQARWTSHHAAPL